MKLLTNHSKLLLVLFALTSLTTAACVSPGTPGPTDGTDTDVNLQNRNPNPADPKMDPNMIPEGMSTWDGERPPVESLVADFNPTVHVKYFNNTTALEPIADGREQGVRYFVNFTDAVGRYKYQSRRECSFEDFLVFKAITGGRASGPIETANGAGTTDIGVVLSNPSNIMIAAITEADAPPAATGACRAPDMKTNYEYEGMARVRHITIGIEVTRTPERCATFCRAQNNDSPGCVTACNETSTPFTGQTDLVVSNRFQVESSTQSVESSPQPVNTLDLNTSSHVLSGDVTVILN